MISKHNLAYIIVAKAQRVLYSVSGMGRVCRSRAGETQKGDEMADDKNLEEAYPEHPFSEMVWLSIKLACVLGSFERNLPADRQHVEPAEAAHSI